MRKIARRRKSKKNIIFFAIILVVIVFVCSSGYAYFSQRLNLNGIVKLGIDNTECNIHKFSGYNNFSNEVTYEIYDDNNGYNVHAMITVTNLGDKYVNNWRSYVVLPENVIEKSAYNCKQVYEGSKVDVFENPETNYNNVIESGKSITFDIQYKVSGNDYQIKDVATYGFNTYLERVPDLADFSNCLNGGEVTDDNNGTIAATYTKTSGWSDSTYDYYDTTITITNNYSEDIENWYVTLEMGEDGSIPGCWSATCSQVGTRVTITQPSWKKIIPANGSIEISFQIRVLKGYSFSIVETGILS